LRYSQRKSPICNRKSLAGKFSQEQATINIPAAGSPVEEGTVIVQPVVEADDPLLETVFACPEPCRRALPPEEPKAAPVAAETVFGAPSLAAINEAWQANSLAAVPPLAEPDGINWGAGALAAAAGMSAYYLSKRREEEEAQRRAVREQVAAKNDALRAKEAQQREQAKIENYLQGKAMLEAQLASSDLSDAEKAEIRDRLKAEGVASAMGLTTEKAIAQHEREAQAQQAKREFELAWLLDADKSENERHAEHINSDEYKAYQAKLLAWHQEQERKKAEEAERQQHSATWAAFRELEKGSYTAPMCGPEDDAKILPHPDGVLAGKTYKAIAPALVGFDDAWQVRHVNLNMLDSGHISVSSNVPPGTRATYKANLNANHNLNLAGTRYLPQTVANNRFWGSVRGAGKAGAWSLPISAIGNAIEYGWGSSSLEELSDRTVKNQDYWSSTVADTIVGIGAGLAAAALVAGTIVGLVALGFAAAATAPVWLTVGATVVVASLIGVACTNFGVDDYVKGQVDNVIDSVQSWLGG
jgi:hypothetical protein